MFGLCDYHSYTLMAAMAVPIKEGANKYRYLMCLRNPWGRKEWKGPWSDHSPTWDKYPYIDKELRQRTENNTASRISTSTLGAADDGRFWMLFKDFFQFFYSLTISYTSDKFYHTRISDEIPDEEWGVSRITIPKKTDVAFLSIYQMNMKFFDPEEDAIDQLQMESVNKNDDLASNLMK